jgi:hypothetical protein
VQNHAAVRAVRSNIFAIVSLPTNACSAAKMISTPIPGPMGIGAKPGQPGGSNVCGNEAAPMHCCKKIFSDFF